MKLEGWYDSGKETFWCTEDVASCSLLSRNEEKQA